MSPLGFGSQVVIQKAGTNMNRDKIHQVISAFIDTRDRLFVCVKGIYSDDPTEYWLIIPINVIEHKPESIDQVEGYSSYWKESYKQYWHLPRENITHLNCSVKKKNVKRDLPIVSITGGMHGSSKTETAMNRYLESYSGTEAVFQLNVTDGAGEPISRRQIGYGNKLSQFGDKHTVMFSINPYYEQGSRAWYIALPFAWALDVVSWPIQLFMWVEYAGAH